MKRFSRLSTFPLPGLLSGLFPSLFLGLSLGLALALLPDPASAYIGPGAGLGALAVTVAIVLGAVLLLIGLVWYPLKRLLKSRSNGGTPRDPAE